jgi:hypothetical protein
MWLQPHADPKSVGVILCVSVAKYKADKLGDSSSFSKIMFIVLIRFWQSNDLNESNQSNKLNPPRGKPRGGFTVRMKVYFQFARQPLRPDKRDLCFASTSGGVSARYRGSMSG